MLVNDVVIDEILQDDYLDHQSEFNWRRGNRPYNKTSFFCLPMISMSIEGNACAKYLRNAYINDANIEHDFINPLFVLFKVPNIKEKPWQDFVKAASIRDVYITDYYVGQEGTSSLYMYVFKIPKVYEDDYINFKKGRYSLMSAEYKSKFPQYLYSPSGTKRESRMWGILNKSDSLKDEVVKMFIVPTTSSPEDVISLRRDMDNWNEVWDAPNFKSEIFHYKEYATEDSIWKYS